MPQPADNSPAHAACDGVHRFFSVAVPPSTGRQAAGANAFVWPVTQLDSNQTIRLSEFIAFKVVSQQERFLQSTV
jgi:hypothetical protein